MTHQCIVCDGYDCGSTWCRGSGPGTMTDGMRAKIDSILAAHVEWQRGAINEPEYLRRADITDAQHTAIEQGRSRFADDRAVLVRIANVLYPV